MSRDVISWVILGAFLFSAGIAFGQQQGPEDIVVVGCSKEIETYCPNVTPGQGRIQACLYAYGDKLSGRCEYALYEASAQLDLALTAMFYLANECREELRAYCSETQPGQARLLACLDQNKDKLSNRCLSALKDMTQK